MFSSTVTTVLHTWSFIEASVSLQGGGGNLLFQMLGETWHQAEQSLQGERRLLRRRVEACGSGDGETVGDSQVLTKSYLHIRLI